MKSREAIRKKILAYITLIWGTKRTDRLDPLVKLMVDEMSNEIYLIYNRIEDIEATILEKIAKIITTAEYISVRPSHTIIQARPALPVFTITKDTPLYMNEIPPGTFVRQIETIAFHPVIDTVLWDARLAYTFHNRQLNTITGYDEKEVKATTTKRVTYNSVWLGLEIDEGIENLKGLSFYIDFPHLSEIHNYYEILPDTTCFINNREVKLRSGFSSAPDKKYDEPDKSILYHYADHYLTIDDNIYLRKTPLMALPEEIKDFFIHEQVADMPSLLWVRLQFLPYFSPDDLDRIQVAVNTFPAYNKKLSQIRVIKDSLLKTSVLIANRYEKLLGVKEVFDSEGNLYKPDTDQTRDIPGIYFLEKINPIFQEPYILSDIIERLRDVIQEEKVAFPNINIDLLNDLMNSITNSENGVVDRTGGNKRDEDRITGNINFTPFEETREITVRYWVTFGEPLNGISAGRYFSAPKNSPLHGVEAVSITEIHGSKEFRDIKELPSINKYILTSRNKIFTDHDIISFCESELKDIIERVEIELSDRVSLKPKEGLIRSIHVNLYPSSRYPERIRRKGVLRRLKSQLHHRSPQHYNYCINIVER